MGGTLKQMITVQLSEKPYQVEKNSTLYDFLIRYHNRTDGYAVMLNQHFVPAAYHTKTLLYEGDIIEIITPMQGG